MKAPWRRVEAAELRRATRAALDPATQAEAARIVEDVRVGGEQALRAHAERLGDLRPGEPLVRGPAELIAARDGLPAADRALLERTAARIEAFARAQRQCLAPLDVPVPGGRAGHRWLPVAAVGAYAPGGRYPLPSSALMTAIPARVAGVPLARLASPRPAAITLAAAAVAGCEQVLAVGGALAVAAFAFGVGGPACDMVVGPGNRWFTAAKRHLFGEIGLDGLAGPSELLVVADASADPAWVAADLLAQAEHDVDARAVLVATNADLVAAVDAELARQLAALPTAATAAAALANAGRVALASDVESAIAVADRLAPEHLQLMVRDARAWAARPRAYGALFVGSRSAEVFGDYGIGPNHVLPTGGTARFQAGLSVATFLRPATWLDVDDPAVVAADAADLAALEGLPGHAAAAAARLCDGMATAAATRPGGR
ncbi:MAG: histidinol dehydrogenase [Planctomycetota bacterium]|jgi:histidinol dehydrogenase